MGFRIANLTEGAREKIAASPLPGRLCLLIRQGAMVP